MHIIIVIGMEIKKTVKNPLKLRNTSRLGIRPISVSMPDELILKLNSVTQENERSAYICRVLKQHFTKIDESDPRYILRQTQIRYDEWTRIENNKLRGLRNALKLAEMGFNEKDKEYKGEITKLKLEAESKMRELISE